MNISKELEGERIAKDVADRAAALDILERNRPTRWWEYMLTFVLAGGWSWLTVLASSRWLLGLASGVGLFVSVAAFSECVHLRRRVDALQALIRPQHRS